MKYKILIILLIYLATKLETKYKDLAICIWLIGRCTHARFRTFANEIIINNKNYLEKGYFFNWSLGASSCTLFVIILFFK
jgi:hypothetical protein